MIEEINIPKLPSRCQVCHHEKRFEIQKAIDDGMKPDELIQKYNITLSSLQNHNKVDHRVELLKWGWFDRSIRNTAVIYDKMLCEMAKKGLSAAEKMNTDDLKPGDIIKLIELGKRVQGEMIDKHEITVKQSLGDKIKEFLNVDETKDILVGDN